MDKQELLHKLRAKLPELKALGVSGLYLFGSYARDEQHEGSDVDLFFDYDRKGFDLFDLMEVQTIISKDLGIPADVMTRGSIHPLIKEKVIAGAEKIA